MAFTAKINPLGEKKKKSNNRQVVGLKLLRKEASMMEALL